MPKKHHAPSTIEHATGLSTKELAKLTSPPAGFKAKHGTPIPDGLILWCSGRASRVLHAYATIAWFIQDRRQARLGLEAIADVMGMSIASTKLAIQELLKGGWLQRKTIKLSNDRNGYSVYRIPRCPVANRLANKRQPISQVLNKGSATQDAYLANDYIPDDTYLDALKPSDN